LADKQSNHKTRNASKVAYTVFTHKFDQYTKDHTYPKTQRGQQNNTETKRVFDYVSPLDLLEEDYLRKAPQSKPETEGNYSEISGH
jgi:hypothetical protein